MNNARETRAKSGLIVGALTGLVIAGLAALPQHREIEAEGAIAKVNDRHIDRTEYAAAYQALVSDTTTAPSLADKRMTLDRLIEEELLVQRGLEIGLLEGDRSVRKAVARAVIQFAIAQNEAAPVSEEDLRNHYQENLSRFTPADRLQVERLFIRATDDPQAVAARLEAVRTALRQGDPFGDVAARLGDPILPPVPRTLLPRAKMIDYLGPDLTRAASYLPAGSISDALKSKNGWQFLYVVANQKGTPPPFEALRAQIGESLQHQRDDAALRNYIDWLRARADVDLAEDAPQ